MFTCLAKNNRAKQPIHSMSTDLLSIMALHWGSKLNHPYLDLNDNHFDKVPHWKGNWNILQRSSQKIFGWNLNNCYKKWLFELSKWQRCKKVMNVSAENVFFLGLWVFLYPEILKPLSQRCSTRHYEKAMAIKVKFTW